MSLSTRQFKYLIALSFKEIQGEEREISFKEYCEAVGEAMNRPGYFPTVGKDQEKKKKNFPNNLKKYKSQNFQKNDFSVIDSRERIKLFYKIAGYADLNDFLDNHQNHLPPEQYTEILEQLNLPLHDYKDITEIPDYLIPDHTFDQLEFESRNLEVNCITHNLWWAKDRIPHKIKEIGESNNVYKYLLTEPSESAEIAIQKVLTNPELKKQIQIQHLWEIDTHRPFLKVGIEFPISNDIVIYRDLPSRRFRQAVIGAKTTSSKEMNGCSIVIDESRAFGIAQWFDSIWAALEGDKSTG